MARWHELFGDFVVDIDVSDFADSEARARHLLRICGLDWHADCAAPVESEPVLNDWDDTARAENARAQRAAWLRAHPELH